MLSNEQEAPYHPLRKEPRARVRVRVSLPKELVAQLRREAALYGIPLSRLIEQRLVDSALILR